MNIKKGFKIFGYIILSIGIIGVLAICQLFAESNNFKRNVTSGAKTFYNESDYVKVTGAFNTTYPNSVEIKCNKWNLECTLIQASLYNDIDMLDVNKEDFKITEWNNDIIKAEDEGLQYIFELTINLKNEDISYTKHPLSKKGVLGNNLETTTFKLYDGWIVDLNRQELEVKEAKWWKVPLSKIFLFIFPLKEDSKIDLI